MSRVGECPYRLRINHAKKGLDSTWFYDEKFVLEKFPGSTSVLEIDGSMYLGFLHHGAIQRAFATACDHFTKRMIDPHALHVTISRYHTLNDLKTYFSRYGHVYCVVDHLSIKGRYAFVNFMCREASLRALRDGSVHMINGSRVKVRGKVLSATEPYSPAPYSPARLLM